MTKDGVLTIHGKPLGTGSETLGELRSSAHLLQDFNELRRRFEQDGYLYLPGLLDRDTLSAARQTMLEALAELDFIDTDYPLSDGIARREISVSAREMVGLSRNNEPLRRALYGGPMIAFYERFPGRSDSSARLHLVPRQVVWRGNRHQPSL